VTDQTTAATVEETSTELVARPHSTALATRAEFSAEDVDTIKNTVAKGTSDSELKLFLATSQRTGLDPFARQIYAVMRNEWNPETRESTPKMAIQTGIDGYRLIANRSGLFRGRVGPYWCGPDGEWRDAWLSETPPVAAKVGVLRSDCSEPIWAVALWREYAQTKRDGSPMAMWAKMPTVMLAKCAEAQAIRASFPQETSGVYTAEEMAQVDSEPYRPQGVPAVAEVATAPPADATITAPTLKRLQATIRGAGLRGDDHAERLYRYGLRAIYGVTSSKELTEADARKLIGALTGDSRDAVRDRFWDRAITRIEQTLDDDADLRELDGDVIEAEIVEDGSDVLRGGGEIAAAIKDAASRELPGDSPYDLPEDGEAA
jgi:phage recombination protein Bet